MVVVLLLLIFLIRLLVLAVVVGAIVKVLLSTVLVALVVLAILILLVIGIVLHDSHLTAVSMPDRVIFLFTFSKKFQKSIHKPFHLCYNDLNIHNIW